MTGAPTPAAGIADPQGIALYHAHIYYDPASTRHQAAALREQLAMAFPDARLGNWHDQPVGPHTQAMYQVVFQPERLAAILPWLMLNRQGLAVLIHPETGNDYADHLRHAAWLGAVLAIKAEVLSGAR
ncbi:MAG TPA: DOPA 4,5-dioxygenase family protein [Stellaceae bacterium]|nr:DOPA 4,5-dioxygenase family protein [Stellaceae bacterium]